MPVFVLVELFWVMVLLFFVAVVTVEVAIRYGLLPRTALKFATSGQVFGMVILLPLVINAAYAIGQMCATV